MEKLINENSVLIKGLQNYMGKKYLESFFSNEIIKVKVSSIHVITKNFFPYKALVTFKDKKSKDIFLGFKNKLYGGFSLNIDITDTVEPSDLIEINEISNDRLLEFEIKYNQLILTSYERIAKEDGLIYKDDKVISEQSKVLAYLIKKIGRNLLKGESIMNISLPVTIFDTRTLLQV